MIRATGVVALIALAACGVDGPPIAPTGAVAPVAEQGVELTPEKGSI